MTINRLKKIRQFLDFNDNDELKTRSIDPKYDKLFKLHPINTVLKERFHTIPMEEHLSLDYQMCPSKVRHSLR